MVKVYFEISANGGGVITTTLSLFEYETLKETVPEKEKFAATADLSTGAENVILITGVLFTLKKYIPRCAILSLTVIFVM